MKKIMFNDRYGLTQAVLEGRKTMTRRIIPLCENDLNFLKVTDRGEWLFSSRTCLDCAFPAYNVGDCLAVAQAYKTLRWPALPGIDWKAITDEVTHSKGWNNKMFVKAEYMPNRICITDLKGERLQDISDEDCLKEGIEEYFPYIDRNPDDKVKSYRFRDKKSEYGYYQLSPIRDCFAALVDRICGKGTWQRNPWVFAYEFELIK
jgi:hypothetical protein